MSIPTVTDLVDAWFCLLSDCQSGEARRNPKKFKADLDSLAKRQSRLSNEHFGEMAELVNKRLRGV